MKEFALKWLTELESTKESKLEKLLGPSFLIETTDKYPGSKRITPGQGSSYYPNLYSSVPRLAIFWVFAAFFILILTRSKFDNLAPTVIALCVVGFAVCVYLSIQQIKKSPRKILVNESGIQIDNQDIIGWEKIVLTAILSKPLGRNMRKYLVIVFNTDHKSLKRIEVELFDYFSWNPYGFASTISNIIEAYKP
jgi:hypothetical protein